MVTERSLRGLQIMSQRYITEPSLSASIKDGFAGEQPYLRDEIGILNNSIVGVNALLTIITDDLVIQDPQLKALNALPGLFPDNPSGELTEAFTCRIDNAMEWAIHLPDAMTTINNETKRGYYKNPYEMKGGGKSVFRSFLFAGYARALATKYMGTQDGEGLPQEEVDTVLKPERDAAKTVLNALCEGAVYWAERDGDVQFELVKWMVAQGWIDVKQDFDPGLVQRAKKLVSPWFIMNFKHNGLS